MTGFVRALEDYFDESCALFDEAVACVGAGPVHHLCLAGQDVQLRFAGHALVPRVLPALAHLAITQSSDVALTVRLWDLRSTKVLLPPPPWDRLAFHERGNARAYRDARFSLSYERRTDVFSAVDNERRLAVYWTRDADALPNFTMAAPMQRLLQGWLRTMGLYVLHAAAIGRPEGGLLLAGRSGSGKSTTALLPLETDLLYAGDDYALVQGEPVPYVHSLYSTAKLNADVFERMPALRPAISNPDRLGEEKALLFLHDWQPDRLATDFPLRAIILPRVAGGRDSTLTPASPLAAFRTIGPDSAFTMLGGDAHGTLGMLKRLVYEVPCFHLALGTDRKGIRAALDVALSHE
jgi:hypothetical protein